MVFVDQSLELFLWGKNNPRLISENAAMQSGDFCAADLLVQIYAITEGWDP
jgi:hypothetical protein